MCGKLIEPSKGGRAKVYCSSSCRQRAYRERKELNIPTRQPLSDDSVAAIIHDVQLDVVSLRDASTRANPLYRPILLELANEIHRVLDERGLA